MKFNSFSEILMQPADLSSNLAQLCFPSSHEPYLLREHLSRDELESRAAESMFADVEAVKGDRWLAWVLLTYIALINEFEGGDWLPIRAACAAEGFDVDQLGPGILIFHLPERAEQLKSMPHKEYLRTFEWKLRRALFLQHVGHQCQLCNHPRDINVHHRCYERKPMEAFTDLIALCRPCHAKFHDKLPEGE